MTSDGCGKGHAPLLSSNQLFSLGALGALGDRVRATARLRPRRENHCCQPNFSLVRRPVLMPHDGRLRGINRDHLNFPV